MCFFIHLSKRVCKPFFFLVLLSWILRGIRKGKERKERKEKIKQRNVDSESKRLCFSTTIVRFCSKGFCFSVVVVGQCERKHKKENARNLEKDQ